MSEKPEYILIGNAKASRAAQIKLVEEHLQGSAVPGMVAKMADAMVGKKVAYVGYTIENGEAWPIIVLEDMTGYTVQMDDEGNGPGTLMGPGGLVLCQTSPVP